MRNLVLIGLGIVIGAAALGAVWAATAGDAIVRISTLPHEDGRVEVGLQQRGEDGEWMDLEQPELRFVPADAEVGEALYSSEIVIPVEVRSETVAAAYHEYLFGAGQGVADGFNAYHAGVSEGEFGALLCIVDVGDAGIDSLCDGLEDRYEGAVERVELADLEELGAYLRERLSTDAELGGLFATSLATAQTAVNARVETGRFVRTTYWIELISPRLPSPDALYCVISHGSEADLFWGLSGEVSQAVAGALGVNLRIESHGAIAEQAAAIQRCVGDGAVAIATTLTDPAGLQPALAAAEAADIRVLSFNSGVEAAAASGSALHIALDDRAAGRAAGEEFNRQGIDGNVLCIVHEAANVGLEERCAGLEETFGGTVERWIARSPATVEAELIARVASGGVDAVLSLSMGSTFTTYFALQDARLQVPQGAFGFSLGLARRVADGRLMFTVLDHPEVQAYLASVGVLMVERFRIDPTAYFQGASILIEPLVADGEAMRALLAGLVEE